MIQLTAQMRILVAVEPDPPGLELSQIPFAAAGARSVETPLKEGPVHHPRYGSRDEWYRVEAPA